MQFDGLCNVAKPVFFVKIIIVILSTDLEIEKNSYNLRILRQLQRIIENTIIRLRILRLFVLPAIVKVQ